MTNRPQLIGQASRFVAMALLAALLGTPGIAVAQTHRITSKPKHPEHIYQKADLEALQNAFVSLAEDVRPSVVAIRTYTLESIRGRANSVLKAPLSKGTGFVISGDGYILTNEHVIEDSDAVDVRLYNGLQYKAEIVQSDFRSDLAMLKIEAEKLRAVQFADFKEVKVNQWAFACGNPFGLASDDGRNSITFGVVSALGRQLTSRLAHTPLEKTMRYYGNLIETSAAINPGVSGGPLFNIDGQVIGVVTAIETSSGVNEGHGYAVPLDKNIRRVIEILKRGDEVRYGFLGVQVGDLKSQEVRSWVRGRANHGAIISDIIFEDGPAAKAGLKPNDIVVEFDGTPVENSDHLIRLVGFTPVGAKAEVVYLRKKIRHKATVELADRRMLLGDTEAGDSTESSEHNDD